MLSILDWQILQTFWNKKVMLVDWLLLHMCPIEDMPLLLGLRLESDKNFMRMYFQKKNIEDV